MASPITSTGIGSGLKIGEMVTALVDAEKAAKQKQITTQTNIQKSSLTAVGQLKSALAAFQSSIKSLGDSSSTAFQAFAAKSSNDLIVKATAGNDAVAGTYSIKIDNLATSSKVGSASLNAAQVSAIPSGQLTITQNGIDSVVKLDNTMTLQQVRDQINTQMQGKGISANIINDANGSRLVLGSTTTGLGSDISVKGSGDIGSLLDVDGTQIMSGTGAGTIGELAKDAKFSIDGLALTSSKNTVENAISGLKLELNAATPTGGVATTVTVATNTDGLRTSLQGFIDSYNTVVRLVDTLTKGTMTDGKFTAAALTGDSTPRNILAAMRKEIAASSATTGLTALSQLGIMTDQKSGTLSLDTTKFNKAIGDKEFGSKIQDFFAGDSGLIKRLDKAVEPFTQAGGVLALRESSLGRIGKRLEADQEALDFRIENLTKSLTKKYNAMDLVVAQLKATGNNITSIFEAMNAQKNAS
ncbi:flagellar filament capping protein FliD [Pseudomonas sp. 21LCFQ010]|uniref:flagellar filament capping protein FliD n=1 Tax=Pseudomonas sp. 21LCFQ010 TaxID=2957506 RepID=UPI002096910B|nr:flagellar filament capping protein FliD [Pseudomonas sp. 21LCFQ010]MCO8163417.1 flagellar filament capping protein FliD [Pseudomonas sp. 21LCFQ010]